MNNILQGRSSIVPENIQETIDASVSGKHALLNSLNQYESPAALADFLVRYLPTNKVSEVFDPQCASGNLVKSVGATVRLGFELDQRFKEVKDGVSRTICNCVRGYDLLDELYPDALVPCQVANPPFGIRWVVGGKTVDSTEYTWGKLIERTSEDGFGMFIANWKTIERLKIDQHPWVYLYQRFPAGIWKQCDVEIGVVHWHRSEDRSPGCERVVHADLSYTASAGMQRVRAYYDQHRPYPRYRYDMDSAVTAIGAMLEEEKSREAQASGGFNIYLERSGRLRAYLSTRTQVKLKLKREEILRIQRIDKAMPITLTTDRDTRKIMDELVNRGVYTVSPQAKAAIENALAEVAVMACPIMPVTDFETVAWADEEDMLECHTSKLGFEAGKKYEISTSSYSFRETFTRKKTHYSEETGVTYTADHNCELSGKDRYVQVGGYRFMDRPDPLRQEYDRPESELWTIFNKPVVQTIADRHPELVKKNLEILRSCEILADFQYYPGQLDYLARVGVKDYGLIGASVGTGKSLMCLSLIQMKAPDRSLIIAPQGTIRPSDAEDDDEDGEVEQQTASQWVNEIRRFAPGQPIFELFGWEDYHWIKKQNGGVLPHGVYISYYQALFQNGSRESIPKSWDNAKIEDLYDVKIPTQRSFLIRNTAREKEDWFEEEKIGTKFDTSRWKKGTVVNHYLKVADVKEIPSFDATAGIGEEKKGIRCILSPCLATICGNEFDFVAVDEAHNACNLTANLSQMLIRMQPKYRYAFTATPIPNVASNVFSLMGWLTTPDWYKDDVRSSAWPFSRGEIARFEETFLSQERDHTQERMNLQKNHDYRGKCVKPSPIISSPARLLKLLKPTLAYISKEACNVDYRPPKIVDVRVPMGKQQSRLYGHFLNRGNIDAKNPLIRARKQIAYLRNICADPAGFTHGGPRVGSNLNPKTVAILDLTRKILERGEQVNIICARVGQSNTLQALLADAGIQVSRIDSTVSPDQHAAQSNLFKTGKTRVQLMGIKCASGHSYSRCPNEIIGSLEYSYGSYEQAKGRVDRVNSEFPVTIYCVLHSGGIEETMYDCVSSKEDSAKICLLGQRVPRDFKPVEMSEVLADSIASFKSEGVEESECAKQWPELREQLRKAYSKRG